MKKRKLIALGLAAALALALTACGAKLTGVGLPQEELKLTVGGTAALEPVFAWDGEAPAEDPAVTYTSAATLTWSSSDEGVATVDETGTVTVVSAGEATITAETVYEVAGSVTLTGKEAAKSSGGGSSGSSASAGGSGSIAAPTENAPEGWGTHGWFYVDVDTTAFDMQNQLRSAAGAAALVWDDSLASIAQSRCEDIAVDFSHNGAQTTGENIAVGYADAASVIAVWQGSTGHYQNMINTVYTRGAIAHMYDGDGCHYWVAVFE